MADHLPGHDHQADTTGMVAVPGGRYTVGSSDFYPDEAPPHERVVAAFEIDRSPVTNAEFARFVTATGYLTVAERALDPAEFPQLGPDERAPGSLVFHPTPGPVDLDDWRQWWRWRPGASWRHPFGAGSDIDDKAAHPVVQVAYADAVAYAEWAGKRLPTEAEHEVAAQGGLGPASPERPYAWGRERDPGGRVVANTWRGRFPHHNVGAHGWRGTSPVGAFPPNPYGIYDLIGNVWEWTSDRYAPSHQEAVAGALPGPPGRAREPESCCSPAATALVDPSPEAGSSTSLRVLKGGSHLCAPEYCLRYRPAARSPQAEDSAATHIGFRCARSPV